MDWAAPAKHPLSSSRNGRLRWRRPDVLGLRVLNKELGQSRGSTLRAPAPVVASRVRKQVSSGVPRAGRDGLRTADGGHSSTVSERGAWLKEVKLTRPFAP